MSLYLYHLVPILSGMYIALAFIFKIYKRSVNGFIGIVGIAIITTCMSYGYINAGLIIIPILTTTLLVRSLLKNDDDKWIHFPHIKHNRRKCDG